MHSFGGTTTSEYHRFAARLGGRYLCERGALAWVQVQSDVHELERTQLNRVEEIRLMLFWL